MGQQLAHLVKMAELSHMQILVVPEEAGLYPAVQGGCILATLGDGSVLARLDHQVRAQVVNQADDIATLQRRWESVRGEALPRRHSLDLIKGGGAIMDLTGARWRKPTRSGSSGGSCVEVADNISGVVGNSTDPSGPVLTLTSQTWRAFVAFARCY